MLETLNVSTANNKSEMSDKRSYAKESLLSLWVKTEGKKCLMLVMSRDSTARNEEEEKRNHARPRRKCNMQSCIRSRTHDLPITTRSVIAHLSRSSHVHITSWYEP